jgi:hypothetical protein
MVASQQEDIDSILTFILLKKICTPIVKLEAYKLGLINSSGKIIREPVTEEEKVALTLLDKLVLKLRRLLGSKTTALNTFLYMQILSNNFYNKLAVKGTVAQRAEIMRIKKDLDKISG